MHFVTLHSITLWQLLFHLLKRIFFSFTWNTLWDFTQTHFCYSALNPLWHSHQTHCATPYLAISCHSLRKHMVSAFTPPFKSLSPHWNTFCRLLFNHIVSLCAQTQCVTLCPTIYKHFSHSSVKDIMSLSIQTHFVTLQSNTLYHSQTSL